jgi:hypothetical protein
MDYAAVVAGLVCGDSVLRLENDRRVTSLSHRQGGGEPNDPTAYYNRRITVLIHVSLFDVIALNGTDARCAPTHELLL